MARIENLMDFGDDEVQSGDGDQWNQSDQGETGINTNQVMVDTMRYMVAKLDLMSTRMDGLEDTLLAAVPMRGQGGGNSAVLPNSQMPGPNLVTSYSAAQTPYITSTPGKVVSEVRIKPSDIKILELDALQRLDSAARLQMFFEPVERCASNSNARLEVAKSRVDGDLAVMIHTAQRQGEIEEWGDCKRYLNREFGVDMNFDQAWRQSDTFHYDWLENPQSFVHKFKCHYAAIQGTFHNEILPDRDRLLKRKLLQGFPRSSRDLLEAFMDDNIPLNKFLGHVENERVLLLKTHASVNSVPSPPVEDISRSPSRSRSQSSVRQQAEMTTSTKSEDSLSKITARLDHLQKQISQSSASGVPSSPRKFCAFCQTETHFLRDCWRKPEKGHCFDCLRYGCRRGNPSCPGKAARSLVSQSNNQKKTIPSSASSSSVHNPQSAVGTTNVSVNEPAQINNTQ